MKYLHIVSTLNPLTLKVLKIMLFLCVLHGFILLQSAIIGYQTGSLIRFSLNVEGLKSLLLSISLSILSAGMVEKTTRSF